MKLSGRKFSGFLVELIIIFTGITLSFWVENYRQSKKDEETENQYLAGFLSDIKRDKIHLNELKSIRNSQRKASLSLLEYYKGKPLKIDSFYFSLLNIQFSHHFLPHTNTFDELISSSNIKLISDQSIKDGILDLRSLYSAIKLQEDHVQHDLSEYLYNNITTTIDYDNFFGVSNKQMSEREIKKLMNVLQFKNFCSILTYNSTELLFKYDQAIMKGDSLIQEIETNLEK
jgi:hypothetical protein